MADFCVTFTKASTLYVPRGFDKVLADFSNPLFIQRITNKKSYMEQCGISDNKLEKILENSQFGLVSKNQLIDIVALVRNPSKKFYETGKNSKSTGTEKIHSTGRYFLKQANANSVNSYILEQEMLTDFKLLNTQLTEQGYKTINPLEVLTHITIVPSQTIGFHPQKLSKVTNLMGENITPILSQPQRKELIHKLYSQ